MVAKLEWLSDPEVFEVNRKKAHSDHKYYETLLEAKEEKEIRFNIKAPDFKAYGTKVIEELEAYAKTVPEYKIADDNREGIRVSTENGWFLLRLSVHDPVMPMNFESNVVGGVEKDIDALRDFFSKFTELDTSAMN